MNRIYQGRVSHLELLDDDNLNPAAIESYGTDRLKNQDNPLWRHHEIFQAAVNYYIVALAALAEGAAENGGSSDEQLAYRLLERLKGSPSDPGIWERFPKRLSGPVEPLSIRKMLRPWLNLEENASLDNAFKRICLVPTAPKELRLRALVHCIGSARGKSGPRNAAKNLEWFVLAKHGKNHDLSKPVKEKEWAEKHLTFWIQQADSVSELRKRLFPHYFSKIDALMPNYSPVESLKYLRDRRETLDSLYSENVVDMALKKVEGEAVLQIPRPAQGALKGDNKNRNFLAYVWFEYVEPTEASMEVLKKLLPVDDKDKDKIESYKADDFEYKDPYLWNGEIPIVSLRERSESGCIFPAFTALPKWGSDLTGQWSWKEFDIAACLQALVILNQFKQNIEKRKAEQTQLEGEICILLGGNPSSDWTPRKTAEGEAKAEPEALPADLLELAFGLEEELTAQLADTVVNLDGAHPLRFGAATYLDIPGHWRISIGSLRGFREIAEKWNKQLDDDGEDFLSETNLQQVVKDYQREDKNKKQVGSISLLLALCQRRYWDLWRKDRDVNQENDPTHNRFLFQVAALHGSVRDWKRSKDPINLTPAEPRHSRRLVDFSQTEANNAQSSKKKIFATPPFLHATIAYPENGIVKKQRTRIQYTAPRLHRDQLLGGDESRWLQPMMAGLGLENSATESKFESAVSLMPDPVRSKDDRKPNGIRYLLNFSKTIVSNELIESIYRLRGQEADIRVDKNGNLTNNSLWQKQFHENWENQKLKSRDWLLWPGVKPSKSQSIIKTSAKGMWWSDKAIISNGFSILSVDLGQRTAGAWALLKITCKKPRVRHRSIGHDGDREWFAEVYRTGILRLPGEDQKVIRPELDTESKPIKGTRVHGRELSGSAGRNSDKNEYTEAYNLALNLKAEEPADWVGGHRQPDQARLKLSREKVKHLKNVPERSYPEQNDALLALANRRLSRLNTFHKWSCFAKALADEKRDDATKRKMVAALFAELEHWKDEEVIFWDESLRKHSYLDQLFPQAPPDPEEESGKKTAIRRQSEIKKATASWNEEQEGLWRKNFDAAHFSEFCNKAGEMFETYRKELKPLLLSLAARTAPLRGKEWDWIIRPKKKEDDPDYGEVVWVETKNEKSPKVRGQRGLSIARLEQLETLRKLFLRYNRSFDKNPGTPSKVGFGYNHPSGEPAQLILAKIDQMKEQRVNQTAHLILAQALGVQLKTDKTPASERKERDLHGEYEIIIDRQGKQRQPVDFIVIENLDRYLTSQGRAPSENRRLMKWSHRAIRDKLKMLAEEPFGIPVVEVPAAYSSRFSAKDSQPGSRCEERAALDDYLREFFQKKADSPPSRKDQPDLRPFYSSLLSQFGVLTKANEKQKHRGKKPHTLLLPKLGGQLFCSAISGPIIQADINAAINIGLRSVAAPESLDLLHKVRTQKSGSKYFAGRKTHSDKNAREKCTFEKGASLKLGRKKSDKVIKSQSPNFFFHAPEARSEYDYDLATLHDSQGKTHDLFSGIAFHSKTDFLVLKRIIAMNDERLKKWGVDCQ